MFSDDTNHVPQSRSKRKGRLYESDCRRLGRLPLLEGIQARVPVCNDSADRAEHRQSSVVDLEVAPILVVATALRGNHLEWVAKVARFLALLKVRKEAQLEETDDQE